MKLWIDDVRPAPDGYVWCKSVEEAKNTITNANAKFNTTPLTTNENNPNVIIVNGNANNSKIGLTMVFNIQNINVIATNADI